MLSCRALAPISTALRVLLVTFEGVSLPGKEDFSAQDLEPPLFFELVAISYLLRAGNQSCTAAQSISISSLGGSFHAFGITVQRICHRSSPLDAISF